MWVRNRTVDWILPFNWLFQDVLMMNLHVIQLNVHKEKFHQCMDNFTQEMIRKYQSGSYPTDPNCGGVNISLTATKSAILCPTDSVLNESSLICSTYKYQFMALMVSNHELFISSVEHFKLSKYRGFQYQGIVKCNLVCELHRWCYFCRSV